MRELPKTKYKGIYPLITNGKYLYWQASLMNKGVVQRKNFKSEREAALFYDKLLIVAGRNPVNILKRVN